MPRLAQKDQSWKNLLGESLLYPSLKGVKAYHVPEAIDWRG